MKYPNSSFRFPLSHGNVFTPNMSNSKRLIPKQEQPAIPLNQMTRESWSVDNTRELKIK